MKIITLCGSTRFKNEINAVNAELTMAGDLVISLGGFGHVDIPDNDWTTGGNADKLMLDELHKRKIDLADEIFVVNVGGYIGESTRGEIVYARAHGKTVRYLEDGQDNLIGWNEFNEAAPGDRCNFCDEPIVWLQPECISAPVVWRHKSYNPNRDHAVLKVRR